MSGNRHTHGWTDEQHAELRKRVDEGQSSTQIAKEMQKLRPGLTRNGVIARCNGTGLLLARNKGGPAAHKRKPKPSKPTATPSAKPRNRRDEHSYERVVQVSAPRPPAEPVRAGAFDPRPETQLPLMQRRASQCAWPVGEPPRPSEQLCCGAPVASMETDAPPYCLEHMRLRRGAPLRLIKIGRVA